MCIRVQRLAETVEDVVRTGAAESRTGVWTVIGQEIDQNGNWEDHVLARGRWLPLPGCCVLKPSTFQVAGIFLARMRKGKRKECGKKKLWRTLLMHNFLKL